MHPRKQIRDKIVTLLIGKTDAAANVFPSRVRPIEEESLPTLQVYANSESVSIWQEAPREYERKLSLSIQITAKANDSLEDTLDHIAEQVEDLLRQDHTLGELCRDVILTGTELKSHNNFSKFFVNWNPFGLSEICRDIRFFRKLFSEKLEDTLCFHYRLV